MTAKELERIYNDAYKAVYWTALSLLKNEADAEDIVQDTFVSFIESYSDITDTTKATTLLKKIAANKCLDRIKLAKTDTVENEFLDNVEAVPEDFLPDSIVESAEIRKIIMDIINNSLSDEIRRTLILFYFDDMSTKEIAETLRVPEGTVRRRLNFARNKIKKEVEKYEKENNTKLFGMAALPFLSKLFIKEAEQVPFKAMPASLTSTLSASAKASSHGAGTKIAASSAKKGTGIMINKFVIGAVALVAVAGITIGVILTVVNKHDKHPETTKEAEIEETAEANQTKRVAESDAALVNSYGSASESVETQSNHQVYSLEDMSSDEIYDLLISFSKDISTGDTLDDYSDRFAVKPKTSTEYYCYYFYYPETSMDFVMLIVCNVQKEADGSITVNDDSYVDIGIRLTDYDEAVELYDRFYEYLLQNTPNQAGIPIDDREDPDSWYSCVYCHSGDNYYHFGISFYKNDESNDYTLAVNLPIF